MNLLSVLGVVATMTALSALHTAISEFTEKGDLSRPMIVTLLLSVFSATLIWIVEGL